MLSEQQRQRIMRYGAQREQFLAARATTLRGADTEVDDEPRSAGMPRLLYGALVVLPLALAVLAGTLDIAMLLTGAAGYSASAGYLLLAASVAGVVSAAAGTVVWAATSAGDPARRLSAWHAAANVGVTLTAIVAWSTRRADLGEPSLLSLSLALTGAALAMLTGWLAGEMLARLDPAIFVVSWDDPLPSDASVPAIDDDIVPAATGARQVAQA